MVVEQRTYTFHPGKIPEFLSYYLPDALALQRHILGNLLGYFAVEVGPLNQFVHLWGYESFEERLRRRALLAAEPLWQQYLQRGMPLIQSMESKLLMPTPFSPLQ